MMYYDSSNIVQWFYFSNYFGAESPDTVLLIDKICCFVQILIQTASLLILNV